MPLTIDVTPPFTLRFDMAMPRQYVATFIFAAPCEAGVTLLMSAMPIAAAKAMPPITLRYD